MSASTTQRIADHPEVIPGLSRSETSSTITPRTISAKTMRTATESAGPRKSWTVFQVRRNGCWRRRRERSFTGRILAARGGRAPAVAVGSGPRVDEQQVRHVADQEPDEEPD